MGYSAHIKIDSDRKEIRQSVAEHCQNCAKYASDTSIAGLESTAYLAGLLHDIGKNTAAFNRYIEKAAAGEQVKRGSVNHTFAGVRFVMEHWHENKPCLSSAVSELLAIIIGSHHGLFDCIGQHGDDGFKHRIEKEGIYYEEAIQAFWESGVSEKELNFLFEKAKREIEGINLLVAEYCKGNDGSKAYALVRTEHLFGFSLLARMLLSAVIDADWRDTAEFMHGMKMEKQAATKELWESCLANLEQKLLKFPQDSEIAKIRTAISNECLNAARLGAGIYRLTVPTGGGKTLTSLRYALATAAQHGKSRIVFVTPLLSVLEQNADVIREYIENDNIILEHHSNIVCENNEDDESAEKELLMQAWDSPVIITTLVQLLNTLFLGRNSCVRRMSALAEAVIVIDEIQSVPGNMISLFNMAMNFLASVCHATIVLCSATHPCLDRTKHSLNFAAQAELVPYSSELWNLFERTKIIDKRKKGGYSIGELADFAVLCADENKNLLLVCNKKNQALSLYKTILQQTSMKVFHLSTSMCAQQRTDTLKKIIECLENKEPIICVSTQLVEAGVDFSFGCVIRLLAGIDNIIQAAGRCNRNGEYGENSPVYIVNIDNENLNRLKEIKQAQMATESVLDSFRNDSVAFDNSISSLKSIETYYERLYAEIEYNKQDYPMPEPYNTTIFELLSSNTQFSGLCKSGGSYTFKQAFRTAGESFKVFEDNTTDILVPYGKGAEIIADLCSEKARNDLAYCKKKISEAKRFTVSLYDYEIKKLASCGGLHQILDGYILALLPDFYSSQTGINLESSNSDFLDI